VKNSVQVNGVTLSRKQIEDALKELNRPEPEFRPGDIVRADYAGYTGDMLVVAASARKILKAYYPTIDHDASRLWVINSWGEPCAIDPNRTRLERKGPSWSD
jgi:hypothetical protein